MYRKRFSVRAASIYLSCLLLLSVFAMSRENVFAATPADRSSPTSENESSEPTAAKDLKIWEEEVQPFLTQYCYDCHSGDGAEADIDFEQYASPEGLAKERPKWNQIRGMIDIEAMPPADYEPLPSREERDRVADWIDYKINTVDCGVIQDPGRVTMRRLNSVEYDNTLRDLLAIDFAPSAMIGFPSDSVGNGFDNQGDVLTLSPLQLEKYLQAARLVTSRILVDRDALRKQESDIGALWAGDQAGVSFLFADGEYEVSARLHFEEDDEKRALPVAVLVDGEEIDRWEVAGRQKETYKSRHTFTAGEHQISLHFVEDPYSDEKEYRRRVETDAIFIEGPEGGEPALPESYRRLFVSFPSDDKSVEEAAEEIFRPLIRRAFRRDPTETEVQRVVRLVKMATEEDETFESAVGYGLQSVLVSPKFLFRVEVEPKTDDTEPTESLGDYPLASRLSYFIWASCPDEELLDLARDGKLSDPKVLQKQARRMLADRRSESLVQRFFGQSLGLGNLRDADPDKDQFPAWNDMLRDAMLKETELFCQEIIEKDLPLDVLLTGNFTYINPRLAEHYGVEFDGEDPEELYFAGPGLKRDRRQRDTLYKDEDRWIRVSLPESRQGVLTQAAILTLTSNPTATSPVKRGKWILESVLGDPPPPAPPNVPGFEETQKEHGNLSLRQQLEIHRENPSCASCHRVMDPLGLGFENFDATGRWREKDGKHPIDAAGELADGRKFNGAVELVQLLRSRRVEISKHFAEKLLTYALGRGLEPYDNCTVDDIMTHASKADYRLSAFVESIVASEPFSKRRTIRENNQ